MAHSTWIALAVAALYLVYITAKGELPAYLAIVLGPWPQGAGAAGSGAGGAANILGQASAAAGQAASLASNVEKIGSSIGTFQDFGFSTGGLY